MNTSAVLMQIALPVLELADCQTKGNLERRMLDSRYQICAGVKNAENDPRYLFYVNYEIIFFYFPVSNKIVLN